MWRVSGKCSLFVACAAAIAGVAFTRSSCSTAEFGHLKGREVHIKEQRMMPIVADWKITIAPVCPKVVGISATACDEEGAPAIDFTSEKSALVMRSGELKTGAYVSITVFCDPDVMSLKEHQLKKSLTKGLSSSLQSLVLPKPPPTQPEIPTLPTPTSLLPTEMAETVTSYDFMTHTAALPTYERSLWEKITKWWINLTFKKSSRRFLRFSGRWGLNNVNATRSSIADS